MFRTANTYYVYIMASFSRVIYVGVTRNLVRRVSEHRNGAVEGFTKRYNIHFLVYYEEYADIRDAIQREKQLKSWRRSKKLSLIESLNPGWQELSL